MALNNIGSIQRKLSVIIEEFQRSRDTWEEINSHSFSTANALTNSVIQSKYVDESKYWHPLLKMEFPDILHKYDKKMHYIIEQQSEKLADLLDKMAKQHNKMNAQYKELMGLYNHLKSTNGIDFVNKQPIYQTCPLETYVNRMKTIIEMYNNELESKKKCVHHGFKDILSREEGVVLLSIWIQQPNLIRSTINEWQDICTTEMTIV